MGHGFERIRERVPGSLFRRKDPAYGPSLPSQPPSRSAVDYGPPSTAVINRSVEQIPTIFGRLVYLAALRSRDTGAYHHPVLSHVIGASELDSHLRRSHLQVFYQWLDLNLAQQRGDLVRYLGIDGAEDEEHLRRLRDTNAFAAVMPEQCAPHEHDLFLQNLALVIHSMLFE